MINIPQMDPQKIKVGKTLTFTIRKRATEVRGHLVSQEVSFSGGASFLELINCCRLCLEEPHPNQMLDMTSTYDQEAELSYYDCYEICTKEDLRHFAGPSCVLGNPRKPGSDYET